jgi:sirohydrochlorin cobaltochelatase
MQNPALYEMPPNIRRGILLVGHGTREKQGTDEFFELARRLTELCPLPVAASLLEFQEPTIAQAWDSLAGQDVQHIHVAPLLLFAAGHAKSDIPDEVAKASANTIGITHDQCLPLSRAESIVRLVQRRIETTLHAIETAASRTAILMVGRGSHDPCARSDMFVLSELIRHRIPAASVHTAFYAMTTPTVPAMLDQIANHPDIHAIVVHPHLLFQGRLFDAIARQCEEAAARHPEVQIHLSNYLGPVDEIACALARRVGVEPRQIESQAERRL